jgi:hypothetical protein
MYAALLERVTAPGQDGMRFALFLINLAVFKDLYRKQVFQSDGSTVVPFRFFARLGRKINSVVVTPQKNERSGQLPHCRTENGSIRRGEGDADDRIRDPSADHR